MSVDEAGNRVLRFVSAAQNLTQVGELTNEVTEIAKSGLWRRYRTALGEEQWRECEFDYFLIACNLTWDDVSRVVAWTKAGSGLAPLMDRDAPSGKRRTLEEAAKTWHAASTETLVERAVRLGWTKSSETGELRVAPLPPRVRAKHSYGVTKDEHARQTRAKRITAARRRELDRLARSLLAELADPDERRYVLDRLAIRVVGGRQPSSADELKEWRADARRLKWDAAALAKQWKVTLRTAQRRVARLQDLG